MTTLEDRVRVTLREESLTVPDDLAERVLARVDAQLRHRHALTLTGAVVAVLVAACGALLVIRGGPDTVVSVPAARAPETPAGIGESYRTPTSVSAYVAALDEWVTCLRERGVRVSGPDQDYFVSVDPDPDLEGERNACVHLVPALSDEVERQLQARAADRPTVPHESGPRVPLDP